ncbi:MAG: DUF3180 domain-containing protein [Actinomycetes bacterium]
MRPTRVGTLIALLAGVAAVSWGALRVVETQGASTPNLTWAAPAGVLVLAAVVFSAALALRARFRGRRPPNPLGTARMAVLGKASAHVGPIVGGFYLGYLVLLLPGLDVSSRRARAVLGAVALGAAVLLTSAGLLLERTCRIPGDDEEPPQAPAT